MLSNQVTQNTTASRDVYLQLEKILDNIEFVRSMSKSKLKASSHQLDDVWSNIELLDKSSIELFSPKASAKVPAFKKYIQRLLALGRFDPEVYLMSAFILKKFAEYLSSDLKLSNYALKLFSMSMLISHKILMDTTWKLKDASKILGFGKNSIQKMELFLLQLFEFRVGFNEIERKETLEWLNKAEDQIENQKKIKNRK